MFMESSEGRHYISTIKVNLHWFRCQELMIWTMALLKTTYNYIMQEG